jgi:hypothetical protein
VRLSLKLTTGFADPRGDETGRDHSPLQAHTDGVPHVRTSVRGLIKTGRSPIKGLSFSLSCNRHRIIGSRANELFLLREPHADHQSHGSRQEILRDSHTPTAQQPLIDKMNEHQWLKCPQLTDFGVSQLNGAPQQEALREMRDRRNNP